MVTKTDLAIFRADLIVRLYGATAALAAGLGGLLVAVLDRLP